VTDPERIRDKIAASKKKGLWERVHLKLQQAARRGHRRTVAGTEQAILTGKFRDEAGDLLTPTHSTKSGTRHYYYVSNRLISGGPDPTGWRLPAPKLEAIIPRLIADHLTAATTERRLVAAPDFREGEKLIRTSQDDAVRRCEPVSARTVKLPFMLYRVGAIRRERRCG